MYQGYSFHSYFGEKERPSNRYKIVRVKYKKKYISLVFAKLDSTDLDSTLDYTLDSTMDSTMDSVFDSTLDSSDISKKHHSI